MQVDCTDVLSHTTVVCVVACCFMLYCYAVINKWCCVLKPAAQCCCSLHLPLVLCFRTLKHMLLLLGHMCQNTDCKFSHKMLGTAAYVHILPVVISCIVLCESCCCWNAGIEVDAMRTVAKAYQDRSLQVSHTFPCHC